MGMRVRWCWLACLGMLLAGGLCSRGAERRVSIRVRADSEAPGYEAVHACDGDVSTLWHTRFGEGQTPCPHELVLDLGGVFPLTGLVYVPRQDGGNGSLGQYSIQVGVESEGWGDPILAGELKPLPGKPIELSFAVPVEARYLRLTALSEAHGNPWASAAEVTMVSPGLVFRTESLPAAAHHGAPVPRRRQGPDTTTLDGALDLARLTLDLVQRARLQPVLAERLGVLAREAQALAVGDAAAREVLRGRVLALRRRILLAHPALAFERLLINQRPPPSFRHQTDQYLGRYSGSGPGLVILDHWRESPTATALLQGKLPPGSVLHPDLSFDGESILFSYCDHTSVTEPTLRRFFIWRIQADGSGLQQLTGTASDPMATADGRRTVLIEDWDPCWLPDGGFAFVSTRNQGGVRCHHGDRYCPTYVLYRADVDGTGIRPLAFGEANEWDPSVLHDGRIIWTRWDYINRHDTVYQSLWTTRPDGTGTAHFYGNYTRNPCDITEARAIPGSGKIVATASAHHWYTAGSLIVIDPLVGEDGEAPLTRVTPEAAFPETEGWPSVAFATPWPITEDIFLCAYSEEWEAKANSYAIYLVDTLGGRELIYRDPQMSSFCPIPLQPRTRPPTLPSTLPPADPDEQTASVYIRDVYDSTQPIPAGSVREVRVVRIFPQPVQRVPDRSRVLFEVSKGEVGSAPVAPDGSAAFAAPAGVPLLLQLVDGDGMAVMGMRSFVYLHPGERLSCSGCHENRRSAPPRQGQAVQDFPPLRPPHGPPERHGLSFARAVQPVLDRHCIECHGLKRTAGDLNLLGSLPEQTLELGRVQGSNAYLGLTRRPGLVVAALRNEETPFSRPGDYGARASQLAALLLHGDKQHRPLPPEDFRRMARWLDLNAPFYGGYSWNKDEWRLPDPAGERALRAAIAERFGRELAEQPFAALVNPACPEESRILKATLAESAGGWGQLVEQGWQRADDPAFLRLNELVRAAIAPLAAQDREGTCQQSPCQCGACWVPAAELSYRAGSFQVAPR